MIVETTYTDKEVTKAINELVGRSFSFWERIKLGGIGSHRIQIKSVSEGLEPHINSGYSINNMNIELRPTGIIIHLKWRTQSYAWVIPFSDLSMSLEFEKISDQDHEMELIEPNKHNRSFFKKLLELSKNVS